MGFFTNRKKQKIVFAVTAIFLAAGLIGSTMIGVFAGGPADNAAVAPQTPITGEEKVAALEEQLKDNPDNISTLGELAGAYYDNGQVDESIETYQKALEIDPANSDLRTALAVTYFLEDEHDKAVVQIEQEIKDNPNNNKAHYYLGQFLAYGQGKYDQAVEELQTFVETANTETESTEITKAKQMIEELKNINE